MQTHDIIDAHVHLWTSNLNRFPIDSRYRESEMSPTSFSPEEFFARIGLDGPERTVLIQMSYYGFDNSYMLHCLQRFPSRFRGIAIVDENAKDVDAQLNKLRSQGIRGLRLYADVEGTKSWLHSNAMNRLWLKASTMGFVLCLLADPEALRAVDRMCEMFPETQVAIDHLGRIGMRGPIDASQVADLCRLARHPKVHVKVSAFYALGLKQPPYRDLAPFIRLVRDAFGADRLLWGSDCPFQLDEPHSYAASIELVRNGLDFLNDSERRSILSMTAERLFFAD